MGICLHLGSLPYTPGRAVQANRRPLSACVITRDEESNIEACLASLAFCDERVVVDCGSTDRTVALARSAGARVVEIDWPGMIAQKNRAADAAAHDWILSIDADERVSDALRASILAATIGDGDGGAAGYAMAWETVYLGGPIRSDRGRARWKLRLYDRRRGRWEGHEPHGHVHVAGTVPRLTGPLYHTTVRSLEQHVAKTNAYTDAAALELRGQGRSLAFGLLVRPPAAFLRSFVLRGGFRDGARGFIVAVNAAAYVFLKYAKLWELRHPDAPEDGPASGGSPGRP